MDLRLQGQAPRVLVVEDNEDHQLFMSRALERAGAITTVAGSGEEALPLLENVDLVLVDNGLPRMSGIELMDRISAMEDGPSTIVVTASASSDVIVQALRRGAVDFVSKEPGYIDLLPAVIERAFQQHDLSRRHRELQRLALLVHQPLGRHDTIHEIVTGARRLLRARGCLLALQDPDGSWRVQEVVGPEDDLLVALRAVASDESDSDLPGVMVVRLPEEPGEAKGILVAMRDSDHEFIGEERSLAQTFAAFAASALRNIRRYELERGLVAELQNMIRARQDFVASVSHELRTPLTAIGGFAETLLLREEAVDSELRRSLLAKIRTHSTELERLIDQLLDVADFERGRRFEARLRPVDLDPIVHSTVEGLAPQLQGRDVVTALEDLVVLADPDLVTRALSNLLTNAVKYTVPGTRIEITAVGEGDTARIAVRDHGEGLDPRDTARVFEPFWRGGEAVSGAIRGTGIGLSLVREYVRSMGGDVGVESVAGRGATFWFTLPMAAPGGGASD